MHQARLFHRVASTPPCLHDEQPRQHPRLLLRFHPHHSREHNPYSPAQIPKRRSTSDYSRTISPLRKATHIAPLRSYSRSARKRYPECSCPVFSFVLTVYLSALMSKPKKQNDCAHGNAAHP